MTNESIGIAVAFGKVKVVFHQKLISVAEENRLRERLYGMTEKDKEEKSFDLNISALSEYAEKSCEIIRVDENGKEHKTEISVAEYFKNKSSSKERIAEYAMRGWLVSLQPDVSFLQ